MINRSDGLGREPPTHISYQNMPGYKNFAIVGAGITGSFIVHQFLKDKAAGTVNEVVVLTREVSPAAVAVVFFTPRAYDGMRRQGSKTTIDGDAKVIPVDYSDKESVKRALAGIDVIISTIATVALGLQTGIAEAAKEAGVKLFIPSEFGIPTEGVTEGPFGAKARVRDQLKAVGIPYALFNTGPYADALWVPYAAAS